jgi:hypothetical protein
MSGKNDQIGKLPLPAAEEKNLEGELSHGSEPESELTISVSSELRKKSKPSSSAVLSPKDHQPNPDA